MKKNLKQDLENYTQPKYFVNSYTTGNITYGGSCPDPRHNATKWKMLNGGYGAEQQKIAQERVDKNIRWLNNSYDSKAEESEEEQELEEIQEEKPQSNMTELEQALARIKALEEANKQLTQENQQLKQQAPSNKDNSMDKSEVQEIVKKLQEDFAEVKKESEAKNQIIEKQAEENRAKDEIIEKQATKLSAQDEKIKANAEIKKIHLDQISELKEDKKYFKDEAKNLKTELKGSYTKNQELQKKVQDGNMISEIQKNEINSLKEQLSKFSLFDNNSGNNENNISESFQVVDTSGNDSGLNNLDIQ